MERDKIKKWSWGAFGFRWIWGLFMGVLWPLYYKIGYILLMTLLMPLMVEDGNPTKAFFFTAGVFVATDIAVSIYLGIIGRRQAWHSNRRNWTSRERFLHYEKLWSILFFVALIVLLVFAFFTSWQFLAEFFRSGSMPSEIRSLP